MDDFTEIDRFHISGRGVAITTTLPRDFTVSELEALSGNKVQVNGKEYVCGGVETYANQPIGGVRREGEPIALVIR